MINGERRPAAALLVCLLAGLAAISILAYGLSLSIPFIADDYVQIVLARDFGPFDGWPKLAEDALYRCRATSLVLTYWTERLFGLNVLAYSISKIGLHIFNVWLVFGLGLWRRIGWRTATAAAAFFAVYEGHQEAVIWYAALPELLVFFFSVACILAWIAWRQNPRHPRWMLAGSFALFVFALASKESAVVVVPLLILICLIERESARAYLWTLPFAGAATLYTLAIFAASANHLHFNDGTFSLSAPFGWTLLNSSLRLCWPTGLVAILCLSVWRRQQLRPVLVFSGAWVIITFLPYSFLTYMHRVPSRHTYFASAGLAIIIGVWLLQVHQRFQKKGRWVAGALTAAMLLHNCGYLWTRKQQQFLARAEPTEKLIEFARHVQGPVTIQCFPYSIWVARFALQTTLGKDALEPNQQEPATRERTFCLKEPGSPSVGQSD